MKLNQQEILQHNPELLRLRDGEQTNINHINCPAGRDSKKRLYVRKKDGSLLFFCHHCQSGAAKHGKKRYIRDRPMVQTAWDLKLPADMKPGSTMHVSGTAWLYRYSITLAERELYNIGWSETVGRVILPVYDQAGTLTAYQARRVLPHDHMPKYLTSKNKGCRFPLFLGTKQTKTDTVVLTEDILSAIKVGRQCQAAALLGVNLTRDNRNALLAEGFTKFVVWLDDDNPAVRKAQRDIVRSIEPFATVVKVTGHTCDPKDMQDEQIKSILQAHGVSTSDPVGAA